ncbi:hypothetical protein ACIGNX_22015 [Actinosynnema sp. NPDC053489]|uniref:hypothetical protein n=1 Tax=Actinosynnema sp. NPDC053489 TaxID=3363916 RepID=UPI0037C997F8
MKLTPGTETELYHRFADGVGESLLRQRRPVRYDICRLLAEPTGERCAVYVGIGGDGTVLYVGSVCRAEPGAVADRLREHLRTGFKAATWDTAWIFPLWPATPEHVVRQAESRVATLAGRPPQSLALPQRPVAVRAG